MSLMKDVKEEKEVRIKRTKIRIATWSIIAVVLIIVWFVTK